MHQVLAAGVIIFRITDNLREYLLLEKEPNSSEKWAPPKGRLEKDETDFECAIREAEEETGLSINKDYDLACKNFTVTSSYRSGTKSKRVIYWLARIKDDNVKINLSSEHVSYKWFKLDECRAIMSEDHVTDAIAKADDFLNRQNEPIV